MTEKTYIAALRDKHERALKDLTERLTECSRLNFCMDELSAFTAFSSTVIDQLEAERQRADHNHVMQLAAEDVSASALRDWSNEGIKLHAAEEKIKKLKAELAALRGEQEPVEYQFQHVHADGVWLKV